MSQLKPLDGRPWLIVCEGESDRRFFSQLIEVRQIPNDFQVRYPGRSEEDKRGGRNAIGPWLMTATIVAGWDNIRGVLIVSDNDDDPKKSFAEVIQSLSSAKWPGIPTVEDTVAKARGFPHTVIHMIPESQHGALETMCLTAAYSKWQNIQQPLDNFVQAVGVGAWGPTKESKMRLQSVIAATCKPRPETGFMGHWREDSD